MTASRARDPKCDMSKAEDIGPDEASANAPADADRLPRGTPRISRDCTLDELGQVAAPGRLHEAGESLFPSRDAASSLKEAVQLKPDDSPDRRLQLPRAPGTRWPAGPIVHRVAAELGRLAGLANDVQAALSLCDLPTAIPPEALHRLQEIDRMTQILEDLARVASALGDGLAHETVSSAPIAEAIRLKELAIRLGTEAGTIPVSGQGDVHWL